MRRIKFMSAVLSGAMAVTMVPQVILADEDADIATEEPVIATEEAEDEVMYLAIDDTNFPDRVFREYISDTFDANHDDNLDTTEISLVGGIDLQGQEVSDLTGINFFTSITSLNVNGTLLNSLELKDLTALTFVDCSENEHLTNLQLTGLTSLSVLYCHLDSLSALDVTGLPALKNLSAYDNNIGSLDFSNCPLLETAVVNGNSLTALDVSGLENLKSLCCSENNISALTLDNPELTLLKCDENNLSTLDVSKCPKLDLLWFDHNDITSIDLTSNETLCNLICCSEYRYNDTFITLMGWVGYAISEQIEGTTSTSYSWCIKYDEGVTLILPDTTPTPTPTETTEAPTAAPTAAIATPVDIPDEPGVSGFVERLYAVALGRNSDDAGKNNWINAITSGSNTGADAARGFLLSPEFLNKDLSTGEFVNVLYLTFFGRVADQAGLNGWVDALNNGSSKEEVIEGFINSTEWANLCLRYGIASGGTGTPNVDIEPNQATVDFATRLYTTCLNRAADQNGLMAWARQLANQRDTGTGAARGFFFSSEFTNQNVSNGEYVTRLYRTFMGREPDQAGYDAWVAQLDSGVSREEVFDGFAQSNEFGVICAQYGIIR